MAVMHTQLFQDAYQYCNNILAYLIGHAVLSLALGTYQHCIIIHI